MLYGLGSGITLEWTTPASKTPVTSAIYHSRSSQPLGNPKVILRFLDRNKLDLESPQILKENLESLP